MRSGDLSLPASENKYRKQRKPPEKQFFSFPSPNTLINKVLQPYYPKPWVMPEVWAPLNFIVEARKC